MEENRRYRRHSVEGRDLHARTVTSVDVQIINISLGGVSVITPKRLNIGGKYSLRMGAGDGIVNLRTEVVWEKLSGSRKEPNGDIIPVYTAGLRFNDAMTPSMGRLKGYLEEFGTVDEQRLSGLRFRIKEPETATLNIPSACTVKKLSLGGMLIAADRPLDVGGTLNMELTVPGTGRTLDVSGGVTSCIETEEESEALFNIGVRFDGLTDNDQDLLQEFISKLDAI